MPYSFPTKTARQQERELVARDTGPVRGAPNLERRANAARELQDSINAQINQGGGTTAAVMQNIANAQARIDQTRQAQAIAAQRQLQRDLSNLQTRQSQGLTAALPSWMQGIGQMNLRNLASKMSGLGALDPLELAAAQERIIRDERGNVVGYRDEFGRLTGRDPYEERARILAQRGQGGQTYPMGYTEPVAPVAPVAAPVTEPAPSPYAAEPQTYARMSLLDVAPSGLLEFAQRYGAGFGTPQDFAAANRAFRMGAGTRPSYYDYPAYLPEYTLLG